MAPTWSCLPGSGGGYRLLAIVIVIVCLPEQSPTTAGDPGAKKELSTRVPAAASGISHGHS